MPRQMHDACHRPGTYRPHAETGAFRLRRSSGDGRAGWCAAGHRAHDARPDGLAQAGRNDRSCAGPCFERLGGTCGVLSRPAKAKRRKPRRGCGGIGTPPAARGHRRHRRGRRILHRMNSAGAGRERAGFADHAYESRRSMRDGMKKASWIGVGAVLGLLLSLNFSVFAQRECAVPIPYEDLQLLSAVFGKIKNDYVEPVSDDKLIHEAITGMVRGPRPAFGFPRRRGVQGTAGRHPGQVRRSRHRGRHRGRRHPRGLADRGHACVQAPASSPAT